MEQIRRALLSVSDKTELVPLAQVLAAAGVELISTGGTAKALREAGLNVTDLSTYTGFPEMLDGRVKTLHPKVHGGLLYIRGNAHHEAAVRAHGIQPIDLVVVNLYPFEQTVARPNVSLEEAIENIDIGGPSMLRSAAKNHESVTVVVDPADYEHRRRTDQGDRPHNPGTAAQAGGQGVRAHCGLRRRYRGALGPGLRSEHQPRRRPRRCASRHRWPNLCVTAKTRTRKPPCTASFTNTSSNCTARSFPTTISWT